jgi:hypothetical protein
MERAGGRIELETDDRPGACFRLTFEAIESGKE